jgi:FHA domain/GAF domain
MPRLLIHHAGEGSRVFELLGDRPISIGRAKSSTVILDDPSVSRLHAIQRVTPEGAWQIIDRESANGVKVNGVTAKETTLHLDDEIVLGEFNLRYEDSASRKVASYGTASLPERFAQVLKKSAYTGKFMPVESIGEIDLPEAESRVNAVEQEHAAEYENRLLALLNRVNRALADLKTVGEVTQCVLGLVLEIDGVERGYTMLVDEASMARGKFHKSSYTFEPAVLRYRDASRMPLGKGAPQLAISRSIIRKVMEGGLPLLITDAQSDPRLSKSTCVAAAGIQSAMCAPLGIGDRLRGLLYVDNLSRRGMFVVEDLNGFSVIAVQAGLAIERIRSRVEVPVP